MEQAGETANLAVIEDGEAMFVAQVECRELMRMSEARRAPGLCVGRQQGDAADAGRRDRRSGAAPAILLHATRLPSR
jgi:hypothetical protein